MIVLGLDMATHTGYAVCDNGKITDSGVWDLGKIRGKEGGHNGHMFLGLSENIADTMCPHSGKYPDLICYEVPHHRGGDATRITVGMSAIALMLAAEFNAEVLGVHSATLKKAMTGSGRASKADMMRESEKFLGRKPIDDDEADAVLLSEFGYRTKEDEE